MTFYTNMASTASRLLAKFGQPVTMRRSGIGVYDPSMGRSTRVSFADVLRNGAVFDYPPGQVNAPGGLIQGGDKRLLLEAGVAPSLGDRVVVESVEYIVKGIQVIDPAGTVVMYDIHLRT